MQLSAAKTRILPCSRHRLAGKTRCEFLGVELRWGKDRKGQEHLKRRTARQNLGPRSSASPRGVRSTATCGCQACASGSTPNSGVRQLLRSPWERRQPEKVLQQRHTAFAEVAQAASPPPPLYLARRPRSPGALQSCPPTDRGTTQDETGSPENLSRRAAASLDVRQRV